MAKQTVKDKFVNLAEVNVTMSAANTLTFTELMFGISMFDKVALLVQRLEFLYSAATLQELVAASDELSAALTISNTIVNLSPLQNQVVDVHQVDVNIVGAATVTHLVHQPTIRDFSSLLGGGILIPARPVYLGLTTAGFAAAAWCSMRMYYSFVPLAADDYWELVEARRMIG